MATEHEGGDVLDRDVELLGQKMAEAGRIEHAGHAHYLLRRQTGELLQRPDHGVERVGDTDHKCVRGVFGNALANRFHDLQVDSQQVVAAHARLARHACGDNADIGAGNCSVIVRARKTGVEAIHGAGFGNIKRLALRDALGDVEQHHVAQFFQTRQMRERAADLTCADQRDFASGHRCLSELCLEFHVTPPSASLLCAQGGRQLHCTISEAKARAPTTAPAIPG